MTHVYNTNPLQVGRHYEIDYIHSYGEVGEFFLGLQKRKLMATRCLNKACGKAWLPPRRDCGACGAKTEWFEAPLEGKVHTFSILHFAAEAFFDQLPFVLAYIELEGIDTVFLSRIEGCAPEDVYIGMPVRAKFRRLVEWTPNDVTFVPA
ncbi:MAG: Zn-ribbon domain-containing OB-fold protein [Dehalococcoidia bacterium]